MHDDRRWDIKHEKDESGSFWYVGTYWKIVFGVQLIVDVFLIARLV